MTKLPPHVVAGVRKAKPMVAEPMLYASLSSHKRRALREAYVAAQDGLCWHCGQDLDDAPPVEITSRPIDWSVFPPNFLGHPVHLHHSHITGLTIGAVHGYCNAVLWQYFGE